MDPVPSLALGTAEVAPLELAEAYGTLAHGGFAAEFDQAMANLEAVLASVGASLADVVKTTVFLRHMSDYPTMNDRYIAAFGDHRPARSAVGVAELPIGALVEIEAIARRPV